jgi:hypothetical protein
MAGRFEAAGGRGTTAALELEILVAARRFGLAEAFTLAALFPPTMLTRFHQPLTRLVDGGFVAQDTARTPSGRLTWAYRLLPLGVAAAKARKMPRVADPAARARSPVVASRGTL